MTFASPNLDLPFIAPAQAQKHVTHNEAISKLDVLTQLVVTEFDIDQPPAEPEEGACYHVGQNPVAAWQGAQGQLAFFSGNGWQFLDPQPGWRAWDIATTQLRVFSAETWLPVKASLDDIESLGVNANADTTNRLTVASDASLFNHLGAGHQLKLNKNTVGDTSSLLFQQDFSGHAEIGLVGDNDLSVKVSDNGSDFITAMKIRGSDGMLEAPCFRSGLLTVARDEVAIIPTIGDGGMIALSLVNPGDPQAPHNALLAYDTGGTLLLVTLVSGTGIINHGTDTLDGSNGEVGRTNLAVTSEGIQIENRFSDSGVYSYTFLNTY